jgi:hypothetical protein
MSDIAAAQPQHRNVYQTIAIVASCLGLTTACGIGPAYKPPPPPPLSPLVLSIQQVSFPPTPVGDDVSQEVTVDNPTDTAVNIGNIRFGSSKDYFNLRSFTRTTNCVGVLAPHTSCRITVLFNPQREGPASVFLRIDFDKYLFQEQRVLVSGVALPKP